MLWQQARQVPGAPDSWNSKSPDDKLISAINVTLAKKAAKQYPNRCVLVVSVNPDLVSAEEFEVLRRELQC